MKTATGNAVLRAYDKAAAKFKRDPQLLASMVDAGFIIPDGQKRGKRTGYQVFVKMFRYSEQLLKEDPITGGLLAHKGRNEGTLRNGRRHA